DRIVSVNDAWNAFAVANGAPELSTSKIIGWSLWSFITDDVTRDIYRKILVAVRKGKPFDFDFRCDSPDYRRFLKMKISVVMDAGVQFETSIVHLEARASQNILRTSRSFNDHLVTICSWCNMINTGENAWHEIEEAINILRLFDVDPAPRLSHGVCDACMEEISK
ncbi:MAG TPA: hypothetical protein VHQ01_09605, partial [Pyrinomonadaceae bacterium]|nr:hypothetical protein [Pyrinomonadaceae bacterium]